MLEARGERKARPNQSVPAGRRIRLITCVSSGIPAGTPRLTPAREPAGSPQRDGPTLSERPGRGTEGERGSPAPHSKLEAALLAAASRTVFATRELEHTE